MKLELRHLEVVLAVAEAGSVGRAAATLKIAQPGLAAQLRRIEQRLGGALFVRGPDGVTPTDLGEHVLGGARDLVDRMQRLLTTSRLLAVRGEPDGPVKLGGAPGLLVPLLVSAVREVLDGREQTTCVNRHADPLVESLAHGDLDLAVLAEFPDMPLRLPPEVSTRPLVTEPIFVGLAAGHRLAGRGEVDLADLADEDWVLPRDTAAGLPLSLRLACEAANFTPRCRHFMADTAAAAALVRSGHAVGGFYPTAPPFPGIVLCPLRGSPLRQRALLAWPVDAPEVAGRVEDIDARLRERYRSAVGESPVYAAWCTAHDRDPAAPN